ncbi:MAG: TfoX/Sxy family protein [Dehalococcoidia bacterium]|nr:MAG: TfoX/Sxy family protein [Dehalococcoidia bacterium]
MPYNLDLEYRIDLLLYRFGEIAKKKMFGGVGYLLNGNMCFGIYKEYLIIRTSKEKSAELLENEYISPFDITGRPMKGWVMVSPDYVETEDQLFNMLDLGVIFTKTLPKKG